MENGQKSRKNIGYEERVLELVHRCVEYVAVTHNCSNGVFRPGHLNSGNETDENPDPSQEGILPNMRSLKFQNASK